MLRLVGSGLGPSYITQKAVQALKLSDIILVETYTSPFSDWLIELAKGVGKEFRVVSREELEDRSKEVVELSKSREVAILVAGDPLIATTHSSLLVEASMLGVPVEVIPGVSGPCSAMSLSGLHFYRFGATATVPGPWRGVRATATALTLLMNLCNDLHTLLLLDVSPQGASMKPSDAVTLLRDELVRLLRDKNPFPSDVMILLVSVSENGVNYGSTRLADGSLPELPVGSLVVPALLHPTEAEYLRYVVGVPNELLEGHQRALRVTDLCKEYREAIQRALPPDN